MIFWAAVVCVVYTYLAYPCLIGVLARLRPRPVRRSPIRPQVSILIVAHDESQWIRRKIENCLALDYPKERLQIVVASDGSTDRTVNIARCYAAQSVTVIAFEARRGKASVLNAVIRKLRGDIIVLSDARQRYERGALAALAENFADPEVGAVSGELMVTNRAGAAVGEGVGFYWRYEKSIRRHESACDSTVGATGAIYAIRKELFEPIPADTLLDDVLIPMAVVRQGYRVVFEPAAMAFDETAATPAQEFTRKVRTIAGNFQIFSRQPWLINPFKNRLWIQTISHKGLRLLGPGLLLAILAANVALLDEWFYRATLALQGLFYSAAGLGHLLKNRGGRSKRWLGVPYVFCFLNLITVVSFYRFVTGRQGVTWTKAG